MASIDKIKVGNTSYTIEAENAIPFVVQIFEGDTGMYADRTAEEIVTAFYSGKNTYAVMFGGVILPLIGFAVNAGENAAVFGVNTGAEIGTAYIDDNGNVTFSGGVLVLEETLPDVINSALEQAKASGEFDGPAGPNTVSTSTSSNISGLLKGNGSKIVAAVAGSDYSTPAILRTATLTAAGWSSSNTQQVTVSGVLADTTKQAINVSPAPESSKAYGEAGIVCTTQGANSLTFSCEAAPESDITVNISIQEAIV